MAERGIFIIGSGAVGASLAASLVAAKERVVGVFDVDDAAVRRVTDTTDIPGFSGALPDRVAAADVVFVTTQDSAIEEVVDRVVGEQLWRPKQVWIHCSGHLTLRVFDKLASRVRGVASMHPVRVFAPRTCTPIPPGTYFAIHGDAHGEPVAQALVRCLEGRPFHLPDAHRALYHCALVMGSNYVAALLSAAAELLDRAGIDTSVRDDMLTSLTHSAVERAAELGIDHSLSGPVRRGDVGVVRDHLQALQEFPELHRLYVQLGMATVRLASHQPGYCQDTARAIRDLLMGA